MGEDILVHGSPSRNLTKKIYHDFLTIAHHKKKLAHSKVFKEHRDRILSSHLQVMAEYLAIPADFHLETVFQRTLTGIFRRTGMFLACSRLTNPYFCFRSSNIVT